MRLKQKLTALFIGIACIAGSVGFSLSANSSAKSADAADATNSFRVYVDLTGWSNIDYVRIGGREASNNAVLSTSDSKYNSNYGTYVLDIATKDTWYDLEVFFSQSNTWWEHDGSTTIHKSDGYAPGHSYKISGIKWARNENNIIYFSCNSPSWNGTLCHIKYLKGSCSNVTGTEITNVYDSGKSTTLISSSSQFARPGYTLTGWSQNEDGSGTVYSLGGPWTVNASQTFYPHWEPVSNSVTVESVPANFGNPTTSSATALTDTTVDLKANPNDGKTFVGWTLNTDHIVKSTDASYSPTITENSAFKAHYYTTSDGTWTIYCDKADCPSLNLRISYGNTSSNTWLHKLIMTQVAGNLYSYDVPKTIDGYTTDTIIFSSGETWGDYNLQTDNIPLGGFVGENARNYNNFKLNNQPSSGIKIPIAEYGHRGTFVIGSFCNWDIFNAKAVDITGRAADIQFAVDDTFKVLTEYLNDNVNSCGYATNGFKGYADRNQDDDQAFAVDQMVNDNDKIKVAVAETYSVSWSESKINVPKAGWTVEFDMQDHGEQVPSQTVLNNGLVTKPDDPEETGWDFGGWYKEAACSNTWDFTTDTVTAETTLYAKWTASSSFSVCVSAVEGTVSDGEETGQTSITYNFYSETSYSVSGQSITVGSKTVTASPDSEKGYDYSFAGWTMSGEGSPTPTSGTITKNTEFIANYTKTLKTYTISYKPNGGTGEIADGTATYGVDFTIPSSLGFTSPTGYTFSHWNTQADGNGSTYNEGDKVQFTADTTLYAQWKVSGSNSPIYVRKDSTAGFEGAPHIYLFNSFTIHTDFPGVEMTLVDGTTDLYTYTPNKYYSYMVITDGEDSNTKKTCDIKLDRISYYGYNTMYVIKNLSTTGSESGHWSSRNYYMNGLSSYPTGSTMRLWIDRNTSGYGNRYTFVYHYWEGTLDKEVIVTDWVNMSTDSSKPRYMGYVDVPLEASGKRGQWKVYDDVNGNLIASSSYTYGSQNSYTAGDNSQIYYFNNNTLANISLGALSDEIGSGYINTDNYHLVFESYCTCSNNANNGYGKISGDNSVTTTWRLNDDTVLTNLGDKTLVDYANSSDYTTGRGTGTSIKIKSKLTYMTLLQEGKLKVSSLTQMLNGEYGDTNTSLIIIIFVSSFLFLSSVSTLLILKKKKRAN